MRRILLLILLATLFSRANAQVNFKVQLDWDNTSCITGNNCNGAVYRYACTGNVGNCPIYDPSSSSFTLLTGTLTQTVSSTNAHFTYIDTVGLANSTPYAYAVTNSFQSNPSVPSPARQITLLTPTGVHNATLNWSNPSCTTLTPCNIQVYRSICSGSICPTYPNATFKALNMSTNLTPTVGTLGTSWQYLDTDSTLVGSTTYVWVATNTYVNASTSSVASTPFVGTTFVGRSKNAKTTIRISVDKH